MQIVVETRQVNLCSDSLMDIHAIWDIFHLRQHTSFTFTSLYTAATSLIDLLALATFQSNLAFLTLDSFFRPWDHNASRHKGGLRQYEECGNDDKHKGRDGVLTAPDVGRQ